MYETLEIERRGKVATIWMNRPAVFNAFDEQLIDELSAACRALDADRSVRVVVLAGRGRHFSAGADLNWMRRAAGFSEAENLADARRFADMLRALAGMGKPTLARVQGAALGGGTGLTAACDMAIAADDAQFSTSEVKFGIIPAVISPFVLRAIGPRHALRLFQSAERVDAVRALAMGLVGEVVTAEQLDAKVDELVKALISASPNAVRACKKLVLDVAEREINAALIAATVQGIADIRASDEGREGVQSFLQKRKPSWLA